ncbi:IS3 family transposase [soil metagenome]
MRDDFHTTELCEALGASRSGYHASRTRPESKRQQENSTLLHAMKPIHDHRHTRAYGSPRMTRQLRLQGHACSENRVARLMRRTGLRARPRKPFRPKTTRPDHAAHPSPNLLAQAAPPTAPGQQIVSDITYIPTREGWLYLAVVIDLFSRAILGWKIADSMDASLVTGALRRALDSGLLRANAIFHSDRGCQYTAGDTRALLARLHLRQSMSAAGYCYDNAFAESAFASLKNELLDDGTPFATKAAATTAVFDYIETFYNRKRLHGSLGFITPQDFLNNHF